MTVLVRQYRPAYFSGFEDEVYRVASFDEATSVPFAARFRSAGFSHFTIEPYDERSGEHIICAHYTKGKYKQWIVAFAIEESAEFAKNWRYAGAKELPR